MKDYNPVRLSNVATGKNVEESEERSEPVNCLYIDSDYVNIRNIHSKRKEYR
jgi:hypothetical protein